MCLQEYIWGRGAVLPYYFEGKLSILNFGAHHISSLGPRVEELENVAFSHIYCKK
jgi:hypothetical protein